MFEPKLAAGHKVSFERAAVDAAKACHISARGNVISRVAGKGSVGPVAGKNVEVLSASARFERLQIIGEVPSRLFERFRVSCQAQNPTAKFFRHISHGLVCAD
jgi:hypothetical protein